MTAAGALVRSVLPWLAVGGVLGLHACGEGDRTCLETYTCSGQAVAGTGHEGGEGGGETGSGGAAGSSAGRASSSGGAAGSSAGRASSSGGAAATGGGGRAASGGAEAGVGGEDDTAAGSGGAAGGKGGAGGKGAAGGPAGATAGSAGATSSCVSASCCVTDEPQTSGPCGTGCECLGDGRPHETRCYDGEDNDGDGDDDCADDDCANLPCTAAPVELDVPIDVDVSVADTSPSSSFDGSNIDVGVPYLSDPDTHRVAFFGATLSPQSGVEITSAELRLYVMSHYGSDQATMTLRAHRATESWNETLTWNQACMTVGKNYTPLIFDAAFVDQVSLEVSACGTMGCVVEDDWYPFDVTTVVQGWYDGSSSNHGFAVTAVPNNGPPNEYSMASSESPDPALRPVLRLTYEATCDPTRLACPAPGD